MKMAANVSRLIRSLILNKVGKTIHVPLYHASTKGCEEPGDKLFGVDVYNPMFEVGTGSKDSHPALEKLDYVDKIHFCHPDLDGDIFISTDIKRCNEINIVGNGIKTVALYMPPKCKETIESNWSNVSVARIMDTITRDPLLATMDDKYRSWLAGTCGRAYAGMPFMSDEQIEVASKWFTGIFVTDDAVERLLGPDDHWQVGKASCDNLKILFGSKEWSGRPLTDLESFRGKFGIKDAIIDGLITGQEWYRDLITRARKCMPPEEFQLASDFFVEYLDTFDLERPFYKEMNEAEKYIDAKKLQFTRAISIGVLAVGGPTLTIPGWASHITTKDNMALLLAWLLSKENELVGTFKDRKGRDFTPLSQINYLLQENVNWDTLTAMKSYVNQINFERRAMEVLINGMDHTRRQPMQQLHLVLTKVTDTHFANGINHVCRRYGWCPKVDMDN